jgi:hypothetical protein
LILDVNGSFMLALLSEAVPVTVTVEGVGASVLFTTASSPPVNAFALVELRRVKAAAFYVAAICVLGLGVDISRSADSRRVSTSHLECPDEASTAIPVHSAPLVKEPPS